MHKKFFRKAVLTFFAACLFSLVALAGDYKSLVGKWNMTSETDGDPVQWELSLKDVDGQLTASLSGQGGEQPVKHFTYKDGVLKFQAPYEGAYYDVELKATAEKLDGSWSGNGNSGHTSGVKAAQ